MNQDLSKSIIFPTQHTLFRCRLIAFVLMIVIATPILLHYYGPFQVFLRLCFGTLMIYLSSLVVVLVMLSFSKHFMRQLEKRVQDQRHEGLAVTVLPLNRLQNFQYQLLGASSRYARDQYGRTYRVMYTDRYHNSFPAYVYCLHRLGPFRLYTVVLDN